MTTTLFVVLVMVAIPAGWEVITLLNSDLQTISAAWQLIGQEWNAFVQYTVPALIGHFWVQPPDHLTLAQHLGEGTEVVLVLFTSWGVFLYFRTHPDAMPLPWGVSLSLILAGVLVGGFAWTIGA